MQSLPEPRQLYFADAGPIPNNPRLPALLYKAAIPLGDDPAADIERVFRENGWPPQWRYGIYPFHHYHSTAHEALGVARGTARVKLGGESGEVFDLGPGDVAVLPAGTGHRCLSSSAGFLVVGAYPPRQEWDLIRGSEPEKKAEAVKRIARVPLPDNDPVLGKNGPLVQVWSRG